MSSCWIDDTYQLHCRNKTKLLEKRYIDTHLELAAITYYINLQLSKRVLKELLYILVLTLYLQEIERLIFFIVSVLHAVRFRASLES